MTHQLLLCKEELLACVDCGQQRSQASLHRKDNWGLVVGSAEEDARRQTIGAIGEWAVMTFFHQPFVCSVNTFKAPDVMVNNVGIQVKASERGKYLIIRPDAKDSEPYVYCHVRIPDGDPREWPKSLAPNAFGLVDFKGWMFPYHARLLADSEPSLWRDPGGRKSPAIFIPTELLCDMEELEALTDGQARG